MLVCNIQISMYITENLSAHFIIINKAIIILINLFRPNLVIVRCLSKLSGMCNSWYFVLLLTCIHTLYILV
jgi:hypothetical protein